MTARASLVRCTSCDRHVRVSEARCPFCDAVVTATELSHADAPLAVTGRYSRAALYAIGAGALSVAAAAAACTHESSVAVYGGPPPELLGPDAGVDARPPAPKR